MLESSLFMLSISVETCLKMCGLEAFADAAIGTLGVEQRKRTTIAVELAAKVGNVKSSSTISRCFKFSRGYFSSLTNRLLG